MPENITRLISFLVLFLTREIQSKGMANSVTSLKVVNI